MLNNPSVSRLLSPQFNSLSAPSLYTNALYVGQPPSSGNANNVLISNGAGGLSWGPVPAPVGLVPYVGATQDVDLTGQELVADDVHGLLTVRGGAVQADNNVTVGNNLVLENGGIGIGNPANYGAAGEVIVADGVGGVSWASVPPPVLTRTENCFYVAKNGNDANNGAFTTPKLTIQAAITAAEALVPTATSQIVIYVAPGQYTENLLFSRGYTSVCAWSSFSDMNEVVELTGTVTVTIVSLPDDLFNRQVILQGFAITGSVTDNSTRQHSIALVKCRIYGTGRLFFQQTNATNRTYLEDCTISQSTAGAGTDAMIEIFSGIAYLERVDGTCRDNASAITISGTATAGRMLYCNWESTTTSATAAPIMRITSTSTSPHGFGYNSFIYTSSTNKSASATSCAILFTSTAAPASASLVNNQWALPGTSHPANHAINNTGAGGAASVILAAWQNAALTSALGGAYQFNNVTTNSASFQFRSSP